MSSIWKSAVVIGASGLVGRELVSALLGDPQVERVITLVRRASGHAHHKLEEHVVDFDRPESWAGLVRGGAVFSALGTTLKVAGSKEAQYRVDHDYQLWAARAARDNGTDVYVLVSAAGSSADSSFFYPRMKGQLENAVQALEFPRTRILRPGFLDGDRAEVRPGERFALPIVRLLPRWKALAGVRPIHVMEVARAGLRAARDPSPGVQILEPARLFELAGD